MARKKAAVKPLSEMAPEEIKSLSKAQLRAAADLDSGVEPGPEKVNLDDLTPEARHARLMQRQGYRKR